MTPPTEQPQPPKRSSLPLFLVALVLLIAGGLAAYVYFGPRGTEETAPPLLAIPEPPDAGAPEADAGPQLSVDDGDALFHRLGASWSSDATFAKWLSGLGLRQVVAATQLVADGKSPRPVLPFLSIAGPFRVIEKEAPRPKKRKQPRPPPKVTIDPASYARYDGLTEVVVSVNAAAVGDVYGQLRPYLQAVFTEIGRPGERYDDVLAKALSRMLSTRVPEGKVELVAKGALYQFKDPELEQASAAEKQLMRMGPANARRIQEQLRTFATHAGLALPVQ